MNRFASRTVLMSLTCAFLIVAIPAQAAADLTMRKTGPVTHISTVNSTLTIRYWDEGEYFTVDVVETTTITLNGRLVSLYQLQIAFLRDRQIPGKVMVATVTHRPGKIAKTITVTD